jgi:phosphoglycolate phosphatase
MKLVIFDFAGTIDSNQELEKDIIANIESLSKKYILAIVSSTSSSYIKNYLKERNMLSNFSDILGSDSVESKTKRVESLLEKYNIRPQDVAYITDTAGDIIEGRKIGINIIGVAWGLDSKETLQKGDPVAIIDNPRDLVSVVESVLK